MSSEEEPVAWLRAQIEARLALAREASPKTDGHWWRRTGDSGDPVGHLWAGEPTLDADGDVWGGEYIVVYDEGAPSDAQFDHMAANDPQDTIARCEAELAILDECARIIGDGINFTLGEQYRAEEFVRLLADGYKHRPGFPVAFAA